MRFSLPVCAALVGSSVLSANAALAATATTTFDVQIVIQDECLIRSAADIDFGSQGGVVDSGIDATGTVEVECTDGTTYDIGLDEGIGAAATVATRRMTSGADTVAYSLYSDAPGGAVWGDTVGVDTVGSTGTGAAQTFTVYGRVPAQNAPAGTYLDTITVTVTY